MNDPGRLTRLNDRQKQVLRLYHRGFEAKEIARELRITPNTVNQHLRDARRILGVDRSVQAARLLAEAEEHNRVGTDPSAIAAVERADQIDGAASVEALSGPARKNRYHLTILQRLGLIVVIAFIAVALAGALIVAADTITRIIRSGQIDISDPPYRK